MKTAMILAKDVVTSIIEGDVDMMAWLRDQAEEYELVVILSCIIEGLELADPATAKGLRSLAELISISRFETMPEQRKAAHEGGTTIRLTADVLLSCLLGKIDSSVVAQMTDKYPVVINDGLLVAALLSVSDEDALHTGNLAAVLKNTRMQLVDPATTDRPRWPEQISPKTISRIRAKSGAYSPFDIR